MRAVVAVTVLAALLYASSVEADYLRGDVSGDGRVDSTDAALILQESAGLDVIAQSPHWWMMELPGELVITRTGCQTDGACWDYPAYFQAHARPPEIVARTGSPWYLVLHELCHAHQWAVGGADWHESAEAHAFAEAGAHHTTTLRPAGAPLHEWHASTCSAYFDNPQRLRTRAPALYAHFQEWIGAKP